jgi:hypothetical protein
MTSEEIRHRMDQIIEQMTTDFSHSMNQFVLNNKMLDYQKKMANLQSQCAHEYESGICKYCDKMEDK